MCDFFEQLLTLTKSSSDDAILIQLDNQDEMGLPHFSDADAIVRRCRSADGDTWGFHTLVFVGERISLMNGVYGSIEDIVQAARYQFGSKLYHCERINVSYRNPDFPSHLIPREFDGMRDIPSSRSLNDASAHQTSFSQF